MIDGNRAAALEVVRGLRRAGHVAYFAGGCVRDALLGLTPKDYDVATDAEPAVVRRLFSNTQSVGAAFGVILVRVGGCQIEVATFRAEGAYSDGRRPDVGGVRFTTAEEDAQRRDFTINGLFFDPEAAGGAGEVIDFVGGRADLERRVLRAIGDADRRFGEDHLRLLRAVRFAARFGLTLDPPTAAAIGRNAVHLRKIAPERVGDEVRRMLTPPTRGLAWPLLRELKLLPELLRFVAALDRPELAVFVRLAPGEPISLALALAGALVEETASAAGLREVFTERAVKQAEAGVRRALRLSNDESEALIGILTGVGPVLAEPFPGLAQQRRFLGAPTGRERLCLLEALLAAGACSDRLTALLPLLRELAGGDNAPPPLVTGDDLIAAGLSPGPGFRRLLDAGYDAQLEGRVDTKAQGLALVLGLLD